MKFRIISLILCILMLVPMLASCGKKEDDSEDKIVTSARKAETIGMYVITEDETTPEAAQAVEDAINKLVKSKYTTKVDITFLKADEYYDKLEASFPKMKEQAAAAKNPSNDTSEDSENADKEAATTEATILNEYGVPELKYPDIPDFQADIFVITDYNKYTEYVSGGNLYSLNEALKDTYKKLNDYIYPAFINAATVNGTVYAIPNNRIIGDECQYLILDKNLTSEYGLNISNVRSISDLAPFFAWVKENKAGVTPILSPINASKVAYLSVDLPNGFVDRFSLVGNLPKIGATTLSAGNLFADEAYVNELLTLAKFKFGGYYGNGTQTKFAAALKTGDAYDMAEYAEDYEIFAIKGDFESKETLCSSMFAISKHTTLFTRAMEVLTYINTDEDIRNLLQYGIKDVNYTIDEKTDILTRIDNSYMMDINLTGNLYIAHAEEGITNNIWDFAKKQNLASVPGVFAGFKLSSLAGEVIDDTATKALTKASAELKAELDACKTYEAYEAVVKAAGEKYAAVVDAFLADANIPNTPYNAYINSQN